MIPNAPTVPLDSVRLGPPIPNPSKIVALGLPPGMPLHLELQACWDDVPRQTGNRRDLIFGVPELVEYISAAMTLEAGDLITTGTPAAVGVFRDPPVFLRPGQTVTIRLEAVGELANPVE